MDPLRWWRAVKAFNGLNERVRVLLEALRAPDSRAELVAQVGPEQRRRMGKAEEQALHPDVHRQPGEGAEVELERQREERPRTRDQQ